MLGRMHPGRVKLLSTASEKFKAVNNYSTADVFLGQTASTSVQRKQQL
jgi:hypothetical protein